MRTGTDTPDLSLLRRRAYAGPACVHELVEEQAARTPERVAVRFEGESVTYRELLDRTSRLARHLRRIGVGPEVRVGVCAERSLDLVVGLLGTLQAGGAYVPLDPSYPADRLAYMVEDAAAPVVLTQGRLASVLPPHGARTVLLDEPGSWEGSEGEPLPAVPPDALAYVMYTSGSTGRPKGAMNSHRAVRNRLLWMLEDLGLDADEILVQKTPFSFDISVWEIFATLAAGARLVVAKPGGHQDPAYLVDLIEREGITLVHFVPSMLRAFLSAPGLERLTSVRRVMCAGEALSTDLEQRFFERFGAGAPELFNLYGPTEAAIEVSWWKCGPGRAGPVPIGWPVANTWLPIVGPDLEPVPSGEEGELLIGGVQPARGYHGRPALTAERFIPDPFADEPGGRLYRTGDLARQRPDGAIEFLGRIDHQVKVRGYRIELGEIESALGGHPAVHQSTVLTREHNGELRLVAYVVSTGERAGLSETLRIHLGTSLPEHMIPADWVFLDAFPLTPSGKVDRKALPEPERVRPGHVPPCTLLERFLAALWEETLQAGSVGLADHFFDLGGTSISGAVVINRLQAEMGEILHVVALFDAPILAELAAYLGREHGAAVARVWGRESLPDGAEPESRAVGRVDEERLEELRRLVQPLAPYPTDEPRNPQAIFVLAPPRSGTTLLRVMLGGHPGLFSPPELELLTFNTMDERRAAFSGRDSFWLEGVLRAVMELLGCGLEEARERVEACEREGWTTRRFYRRLQEWMGARTLVDKSTNYPLDPAVLRRAEEAFAAPFYIHLVRHPYGMIHSFEEAKIDQVFFRRPHPFARRELAELVWTVSHRNVLGFLEAVPAERQHRILFEDLVRDPERELRRLCAALGIGYHAAMADPYQGARMTDGLHGEGRMLGDMKFHEHRGVEAETAERWRQVYTEDFLGAPTWETAEQLGYEWPHTLGLARVPRAAGVALPLSPAQERLWFLDRMVSGTAAAVYNSCREIRLHGPLDVPALAAALSRIEARHEALRTVFREEEGGPVQVVLAPAGVPLPVVDLSKVPGEVRRLSLETARRPFDLRRGPLLRAVLLRLGAEEHALRLDIHHIATDGWSMGLLQRELEALYRPGKKLPELPVQYADYAVWQRSWLESEAAASQLAAWRGRLAGLPPSLDLPADRIRPAVPSYRGGLERLPLETGLLERLEALGRRGDATLFMTLLAGFEALLQRLTGRDDVAVGVPSASRSRPEIESLVGFFVNNLVMRVDLSGDPVFGEALGRVREAARFAYAHPDLPFERLVAELAPERDLSRAPLFQVAFSLQEDRPPLDFGEPLRGEMVDVHTGTSKFDLWLQVEAAAVRAEYASDLFDAGTVRRWLGHLVVLLEGIAEAPEARLSELPLMTVEERQQVLVGWNRTAEVIPDEPVHRLVFRQAERAPAALAVAWEGGELTYGELARRAAALAGRLRSRGVGPETVVALCMERSPELVTAALAVLAAGGAYLPIDPAHPAERVAWIVADSGAAMALQAAPPEDSAAPPEGSASSAESLAYVIYTSGSTGMPKGTELRHRGLSSLAAWHRRAYGLTPADRSALLAGPGFDASVWEMWAPLTAGASLHIPPPEVVPSPSSLLTWLAERRITVAFLPTPLAEAVLAEPLPEGLALRALLTGGDRLRRRPAPGLPFALVNHYGPTESTVVATAGPVSPEGARAPEIGRPIANMRVYLLDRSLRPVPPGVAGELCLAGDGLARGYRGRPDLTAERFIPDPFGGRGERLYRTGDLARWLPSGDLDFLGRLDQQVKIRGFRIEPGEIEAVLGRHPAVREAAVLVHAGRLAACVALRGPETDAGLRSFLAASLPEPMVPSRWVFLEALPQTPNGKVDRRALAALVPEEPAAAELVPPVTDTEKALAVIWAELFGVARIGLADDFFALGGHSLLAARLAFRVRERLGVDLPLRDVLEAGTLAAMAAMVARIESAGGAVVVGPVPLGPESRWAGLPLSFAQLRLWFLESLRPGTPLYNLPQAWSLEGTLALPALAAALGEVVRRHEALRTVFSPSPDGEPLQIVRPPASFDLPVIDLSRLPEAEEAVLREAARRPFDLREGPLFRAMAVRLAEDADADYRLLLTMHHVVSDGWSMEILARELSELYAAALEGRPARLAPLPFQYPDFAVWQRRGQEGMDRRLAWWRERLAGVPVALDLPTDRPRPPVMSLRGAVERMPLPEAGRRSGTTLFMTLLAAFQVLLQRYTGQVDFLVGVPTAGRDRPELEGLVGFFVNLVPVRAGLAGDPPFDGLVARVREAALDAFAHQDVPFERLVEALAPERDLSRPPLVQAMILLLEGPALLQFAGVEAAPVRVHTGTAKLDLTLTLERSADGLWAQVEYASDLFDNATACRLLGHLSTLLAGIAADPSARLSDLPLLGATERAQLAAWNEEQHRGHPAGLLHELFEEQARRTPDAVAVVASSGIATYRELEKRSAGLARRLRGLGVGPEVPVGLFLSRSVDLVAAMLAVLRAGGFYVPIDLAYPEERIAFLLEDSGCPLVLTDSVLLEALPSTSSRTLLVDREAGEGRGGDPPSPQNLAYLIYTSGSTGRPKAVAVEHRNAVVLARWAREVFTPEELSGVIAPTSITFDLSVFEIFVTLSWGGTVFLVENALAVPDFFRSGRSAPTSINTVPSALAELLRIGGLPPSVRTINLAGEALPRALADQAYARPETDRLYNLYGPSEDTTYSTWALVERSGERAPAIGRPVHDTRARVLDDRLNLLPAGVPGELFLAGAGLARGYLGRPELTAERFLPDPAVPGERMYRTGDRVRQRSDGELEYLGRLDGQVKIRGFRVELGEVEAVLSHHPSVRQAAVIARDSRLVAWVAPREPVSRDALRAWLGGRLPDSMVPSLWAFLDALPLTPNGKVDRKALASRALPEETTAAVEAPRNPVEELAAERFAEALDLGRTVGIREDFFRLGGHSLLAVRLAAALDLSVRDIFENPTVLGLAGRMAEVARGGRSAAPLLVPREETADRAPLSFAQERLWFLDRFERGGSAYNLPLAFRIRGAGLRPDALAGALGEVVRRHDALRTIFEDGEDGQPFQVVMPFEPPALPLVDLSGLDDPARREAELAEAPFDLTRGPLVRAALLRVTGEDHRLLLSMHHAVSDGWSVGVLAREISGFYRSATPLPALPVQYADYAVWQRRWLAGENLGAELAWWRGRLAGIPPALELPADRLRPPVQSYRGGVRRAPVPPDVAAALSSLGRHCGATFFMMALAAFGAFLHRITGEDDLVLGTPVANRDRVEAEGLVGLFVNTLVLRTSLAGDPAVEELLARVRSTALEAYAHQELPFEKLVAELAPERNLSRHPLFQVSLSTQDAPRAAPDFGPGLAVELAEVRTPTAKFDLSLHLSREGDGWLASFEYASDLFDAATVDRFLASLGALLAGVAESAARISDLPLLRPAELDALRAVWSGGDAVPPEILTLHGIVEEQARRTPGAVAVEEDGRSWTYAELISRACFVAAALRALGVEPEARVALCAGSSIELVVGLLGVLQAGGACVPLDPGHLSDRLASVLEDSEAVALVTTADLAPRLPDGLPRVLLDGYTRKDAPSRPVLPDQLAYVIYTSGSTGRPKGVAVTHREAAGHCAAVIRDYGLGPGDRVPQVASPAFDMSLEEILPTLASGATLVLSGSETWQADGLARRVDGLGLTVVNLPTALWQLWVQDEAALVAPPPALRLLTVGGEEVLAESVRRWLRTPFAGVPLLNAYGPTEAVITATLHEVTTGTLGTGASVPIGRPLAGRSARVLDRLGGPLPIGVPGELYLGGHLARGYLGRPDLTAERFVPDPEEHGRRLYRTGDRVRLRPDGALEFLGRLDRQVKLRGFRVEPAEIEAALAAHTGVAAAVVLLRDARLVAFLEPRRPAPSGEDLRAFLERRLPAWMIPAGFVFLEQLPLTSSGKVDRVALARLPFDLQAGAGKEEPVTAAEKALAAIWEEVLKVGRVGRGDHFFHLGGHSLLAMRLTSRVRARLGVELELRDLFEAPVLSDLAERVGRSRPAAPQEAPELPAVLAPLSSAQRRLWFLDRLHPGHPAYNLPLVFDVEGPLRVDLLEAALTEILRRHAVLRTTFVIAGDEPVQVVGDPFPHRTARIDLTGLPPAAARPAADRCVREEQRRPFALDRGPLLRSLAIRLGDAEHRLVLTMHHIASDGWSVGVLQRELTALYRALGEGRPSPLPELTFQYQDYAAWQDRWLRGEERERQLRWWRERLTGGPTALDLPTDRPRPAIGSLRGAIESLELPADLTAAVERLGRDRSATPFMVFFTAFAVLLHRYTGELDLWVGTPVANRSRAEVEELIGFLVNTVILRTRVEGEPSFAGLLERVRESTLTDLAHQDLPFEALVESLAPERDLSRNPLFQVFFSMPPEPAARLELAPGVALVPLQARTGTAKLDLALAMHRGDGDRLMASLEYSSDLFDSATARRLLGHLHNLLMGVVAQPASRLSELPLMSPEEREQVVTGWNSTREEIPEEPVHELFRRRAEQAPGALALSWEGGSLTYGQLASRSGALARRLCRRGIGPGSVVALPMERSAELVVAALAVLAAGGAYLPIDPAQPEERVAWMIRDSGATLTLTATTLTADEPGDAVLPEVVPDDLAYVIYTSGSTGLPKGTELPHRGLSNLIGWHLAEYRLGPSDRCTLLAGPGFDASVWETWPALAAGASLHIPPARIVPSPPALLAWMAEEGITVSFLPTPLAEAALSERLPERTALRLLLTGGDRLRRRPPAGLPFELVNCYGPTESTVVATAGCVAPEGGRAPEIGRPIANTRVLILDGSLAPAPVGVPGELCLAGSGLARGYRGLPGLTAERFLPDPFGDRGDRLYRTGDRARWLASGEIELLGRLDHQVKLRGFRVELGEIEAVLTAHPAVETAVVVARGDEARLVAYVVPADGSALDAPGLRSFLERRLPSYMVPAAFVSLAELPLSASGKVDRQALPAPEPQPVSAYVPPRTSLEEEVAEIWKEILGVARVGLYDSFWELGGHSLLATRVLARLEDAFGIDLPLQMLFSAPTLERFARAMGEAVLDSQNETPLLVPREPGSLAPLSFAQERLWFLDRLAGGTIAYNIPAILLIQGSGLSVGSLAAALDEVVRRHEVLRTTFREGDGGELLQAVQGFVPRGLPVVDLANLPDAAAEAERVEARLARLPFDLSHGPLLRSALLRTRAADRLFLCLHHAVADGWSLDILTRELSAAYRALAAGERPALPDLPIQYLDYAIWQRLLLSGTLEEELDWWRERLAGAPTALSLPADHPRPARRSFRGILHRNRLPADLVDALAALGRSADASPFMVLLAGYQAFLARLCGMDDLLVGTPITNRGRVEVEDLIGLFVNTLALRADLSDGPSFAVHLARTRDLVLGAFAHQDLPFERLVEDLAPERDLSRTPLVQALLVLAGGAAKPVELAPGLLLEQRGMGTGTSKMDLALYLSEAADGGLDMSWEADAGLFEPATVARISGWLRSFLAAFSAAPAARVADLPFLAEAERRQLEAWSGSPPSAAAPPTILERFTEWASRIPDAPAVVGETEALSWRELDLRSARLARRLRRLGAGPESRVAICLERSPGMVVAILGVLRSGAAYVPLDPDQPPARRKGILADAGAVFLVSRKEVEETLVEDGEEHLGAPVERPEPASLAYVLYTSGSTGEPKGVGIEHRHLAWYLAGALEKIGVPPQSRFALVTTFAADLGHTSVFGALASGGTLHVVAPELSADPARLADHFERQPVDVLKIVPSHLAALLAAAPRPERVLPRRRLIVGGEASSWELIDRVRELAPECRVLNHYGPTETTVGVLVFDADSRHGETVPLGRPLPGTRVRLLDRALQPVPPGIPGELWVGGEQVARGYLGRPDLTAERFLPDPAAPGPGARLYRTGDRASWLPTGDLGFLGRADDQVKLRGHRVEPGEIAAVLARHPNVREVAVLPRQTSGEVRLTAFVVSAAEVGRADLRAWLAERLPEPMIPAEMLFVEALPLTPNGKVDRRALAETAAADPGGNSLPSPGSSPVEEMMSAVVADLLGHAHVAPDDDFFDLGGHSLLAIRLVARVRETFGAELDVRSVFDRRTVSGLAARVVEILRGEARIPSIDPWEGPPPLSFAQHRLWFLGRLEPGKVTYNVARELRLYGPLNPAALAAALGEVVRRHEPLRTRFEVLDGEPVQVVEPHEPFVLPRIDLSDLPETARRQEVRRQTAEEGLRPFDLRLGPVLRAALLWLGSGEHALLLGVHHISFDAWSLGVLLRELSALYSAFSAARPSPLEPLPVRFTDFAAWQRQWLSGERLEALLAHWRARLAGSLPSLDLPADRPRPAVQSQRGRFEKETFPRRLQIDLERLTRSSRATMFMTLLAGFQTLLHRMTGQEDILTGTPVANRERPEVQGLIGFFVNTLVLRSDLSGDPSFLELLVRVRESALNAYAHQDLPFERLVADLAPGRDLSRTPLFQVAFSWQPMRTGMAELAPGLALTVADVGSGTSKFDLSLVLGETADGLAAGVEYATDLFDAATIRRALEHLGVLLHGLTAEPARRLSELPLMSPEERAQVMVGWNRTCAEIPKKRVHQLVRRHADESPSALALSWEGGSLTYGELAARSGALARRLREQGIGPESVVALHMERSPELIVAALAVLEAGGAYLPIDPAQPEERVGWMVRDSGAALVLTATTMAADGPYGGALPEVDSDGLAYIIYTSGSTGLPKGTELRHRGLSNLIGWHLAEYRIGPSDRCTLLAGPGFDASIWETWSALAAGASLHIPPARVVPLPQALLAWMAKEEITVSFLPTPLAEAVLLERLPERLILRLLLTGGDRLLRRPAADLPFEVVNHYGPTESTVVATAGRVAPEGERAPEIGRPIANTRVLILDGNLEPVPVGVEGELCLAGEGLARGYRRRAGLTAERFLPDPAGDPGGRLYRTGDRARWLAAGQIEFLGRLDHQVKLRGFRVELGEIEAALSAHPAVAAAVAVVRDDGPGGGPRLLLYAVPCAEDVLDVAELRAFLELRLPIYMIPAAIVLLPELPVNASGKVDRKALPLPDLATNIPDFVPPRTSLEKEVAKIWREVLRVERVGLGDNFWDLGGHSLLASKALARLGDSFGLDLPLQTLFESPTLSGFTSAVGHFVLAGTGEELASAMAELEALSEIEARELYETGERF